jgi:hypothetical protein
MSLEIQPGNLAFVNEEPYVVRQLTPEGIWISSQQAPHEMSLLISSNGIWQVYMYNIPHTVRFRAAPIEPSSIDFSALPPKMIREIALSLDYQSIMALCGTSSTFNQAVCNNEHLWKQKFLLDYHWLPENPDNWRELYLNFSSVYAFGYNEYGELGLGDLQDINTPTLIPNIRAQQVAAGDFCSLIMGLQ